MAESTKNNTMMWWLVCLVTTALTLFMLVFADEWFWIPMAFALTSLTKALDVI